MEIYPLVDWTVSVIEGRSLYSTTINSAASEARAHVSANTMAKGVAKLADSLRDKPGWDRTNMGVP